MLTTRVTLNVYPPARIRVRLLRLSERPQVGPERIVMCVDCRKVRVESASTQGPWTQAAEPFTVPEPGVIWSLCPSCAAKYGSPDPDWRPPKA